MTASSSLLIRTPFVVGLAVLVVVAGMVLPVGAAEVTLAWDPNPEPDIAGYRVHYGTSPGVYPNRRETGMGTVTSFVNLPEDMPLYFVVTAFNTAGLESLPSNELVVRTGSETAVSRPPGELLALGSDGTITVEWVEPVSGGISGYTIYRSPTGGNDYTPVATDVTGTRYVDTEVTNGTLYYYVVTATTTAGEESQTSDAVVAMAFDRLAPLVNLTGGSANVSGDFAVTVAFSEPVSGLALGDFVVGGGLASALGGGATVYTATIAPTVPGTVTVTLPAGAVTDAAGNRNLASNTLSVTYAEPVDGSAPQLATGETTERGSASGSPGALAESDGIYQVLTEVVSGGRPTKRYSELRHTWTFAVVGSNPVLHVEAFQSPSVDGDTFIFSYSRDGIHFTEALTVSGTVDDDQTRTAPLGSAGGTLYVRVDDSNHEPGTESHLDALFVDALYITTGEVGDRTNASPRFAGDPIAGPDATVGHAYAASLAGRASDADGDALVFAKVEGPAWLGVGPDGSLVGTPGSANLGQNAFVVEARDGRGGVARTNLIVRVVPASGLLESHVADIVLRPVLSGRNGHSAVATIAIADPAGLPVPGASVAVRWSGSVTGSGVAVTGTSGHAVVESPTNKGPGTFTVTITAVDAPGFTYNPASNVETSDTITTN